jgi:hypothetical protein
MMLTTHLHITLRLIMNRDILLLPVRLHGVDRDNFTFVHLVPQLQYIITLEEHHEILISLQMHAMNFKFSLKGTLHPGLFGFMNLYIVLYLDPLPYTGKGWGATQ